MNEKPFQPESNDSQGEFPALARGLKSIYAARPSVQPTPEADTAIRAAIRAHFAGTSRSPRTRWRTLPWAVAAVILISVTSWLIWPGTHFRQNAPLIAQQPGDIDHNGRIDILDAYQLAGLLDVVDVKTTHLTVDVNNDGTFDQRDVDFLAMQAVQLKPASAPREVRS